MINNKGQAFSVFELMIAAIVAVAILFVLLPILGGINPNATGGPKDAVANALSSVGNAGAVESQVFNLQKGIILTSKNFQEDGYDPHSIIFATDARLDETLFETSQEDGFSTFKYNGSTTFKANSRVICEATGTSLQETLDALEILDEISDIDPESDDACGDEGDYQPCCVVIIQRG